jgi:hypothetical protein
VTTVANDGACDEMNGAEKTACKRLTFFSPNPGHMDKSACEAAASWEKVKNVVERVATSVLLMGRMRVRHSVI